MKKAFVGLVQRAEAWDHAKEAHEQEGFAGHASFMAGLEAEGLIYMAGLMKDSSDILFVFVADSAEQVRARLALDPWQQDGHAKLVRLEETVFRIGPPPGTG